MTLPMPSVRSSVHRVLAIVPHSKGFGFAVYERIRAPLDWGIKRVHGPKNTVSIAKAEALIEQYQPDRLLVEDVDGSSRCRRVRRLIAALVALAGRKGVAVALISEQEIDLVFRKHGARRKHDIAAHIAKKTPALRPRLPSPRKPWQSEDYRITIFVAAAMAWVWLLNERRRAA